MRKHNGMRPQDVAILLKIISYKDELWQLSKLSHSLSISVSEVSESLNRSKIAQLIDFEKKKVKKNNLIDFIEHGLKYVFPQQPGTLVRGIPTAHSHPFIKKSIINNVNYVWPDSKSNVVGLAIEPLYKTQVLGVKEDTTFYLLMALVDVIRVGKLREAKFAIDELKRKILYESSK